MADNTITDNLLLDVLQESDNANDKPMHNAAERDELEELLALYHLSALSENTDGQQLEPMPDDLMDKVLAQGEAFINNQQVPDNVIPLPVAEKPASNFSMPQKIAMAACLLVAVVAWYPKVVEQLQTPETIEQTVAAFSNTENTLSLDWQATEDQAAEGASGQVLWNQAEQKGYMKFKGLAANDPGEYQYQLWIFDKTRDDNKGHPVDGGVFDITNDNAETIVAIDAKLKVDKPYLFAVTIEKPGGVVVSNKERIVVLAKNGV